MSAHVSVVLLRHYVGGGELSEAEVAHASQCPRCAAELRRLATDALAVMGYALEVPREPPARGAVAGLVAVLATLVVMIVPRVTPAALGVPEPLSLAAPEGVHGVQLLHELPPPPGPSRLADGGLLRD